MNPNEIETPRNNKAYTYENNLLSPLVEKEFARQLERELIQAQAEIKHQGIEILDYIARQAELLNEIEKLKIDKNRLDWCEHNLLCLFDGGGAWGIEFGSCGSPIKLDCDGEHGIGGPREAIDLAMKKEKE